MAAKHICEADSGVLILAFAFVPRGFIGEEIKTKSSLSVPFCLSQSHNGPLPGADFFLGSRSIFPFFISHAKVYF